MKKDDFDQNLRLFVKDNLSPSNCFDKNCGKCDKCLITRVYDSVKKLLKNKCIQIGSYPRFTAIKPLHDLDVLYIIGDWDENSHNPKDILTELFNLIGTDYSNPTSYEINISLQAHSVTICFLDKSNTEVFSVDIIPAYRYSKSADFDQDTYKVPELVNRKHGKMRTKYYQKLKKEAREMRWIHTDPRGYIEIAKNINEKNPDFRKTVKLIKSWKNSCKEAYKDFKLKSFHIEQVITQYFQADVSITTFDAIYKFFTNLKEVIEAPSIKDRANNESFVDQYLEKLSNKQKKKILQAKDGFLIKLESLTEDRSIENLIDADFYKRAGNDEKFLFGLFIPVLIDDDLQFRIDGFIQKKEGFRDGWLSQVHNKIAKGKKIKFKIRKDVTKDYSMWKVQNDKNSDEVLRNNSTRGEITKGRTLRDPEETKYSGNHYVECYAIQDNICIAKSKQAVLIP